MKTFMASVLALIMTAFIVPVHAADDGQGTLPQLEAPFKLDELTAGPAQMEDGYYTTTGNDPHPVHLMHELSERESIRLGDKFRLMVWFKLPEGEESPCSRRHEKRCNFTLRIIDAEGNVWENWQSQARLGSSALSVNVPGSISRKAALGSAVAQFEFLSPEGETVPSYNFPLEIR